MHRDSTAFLRLPQANRRRARPPSAPSEAWAPSAPGWAARWAARGAACCGMQALTRRPLQPPCPTGPPLTTSARITFISLCIPAHLGQLNTVRMTVSRRFTSIGISRGADDTRWASSTQICLWQTRAQQQSFCLPEAVCAPPPALWRHPSAGLSCYQMELHGRVVNAVVLTSGHREARHDKSADVHA